VCVVVLQSGVAAGHAALVQQWDALPLFPATVQMSTHVGVALHFAVAWHVTVGPPPESV
jgi:hypothetical protein